MKTFKIWPRLFAVFGLVMMFVTSGLGSDQCSNTSDHIFTASGVGATYNDSYSGNKFDNGDTEYYYFTIPSAGVLTFTRVANTNVSYKYDLSNCPDSSTGTVLNDSNTITFTGAADFNMRIRSSADNQHYDFTFTFVGSQTPPVMGNIPNQNATVGTAFTPLNISTYVTLTNGDAITAYTLTGTLPAGISFNNTTGLLNGTPTASGTYNLSVTATDNDGVSNSDSFSITVLAQTPPTMGSIPNQSATVGIALTPLNISMYVTLTNSDPILSYALVSGTLPAGLTLNTSTGVISGTPTATGTANVSVTATDNDGASNWGTFNIVTAVATTDTHDNTNGRPFTKRTQIDLAGDVEVIGNTVLCNPGGTSCSEPADGTANDEIDVQYVSDSYSTLSFSGTATGANVKWARLYWQGRLIDGSTWDTDAKKTSAKSISLRTPASAIYTSLSNASGDFIDYSTASIYSASIDVTGLVQAGGAGEYHVKDLYTAVGNSSDGLGHYGAWTLVVVYDKPGETQVRDIAVFDGFKRVTSSGTSVEIPASGFLTPTGGLVNSSVYVFSGEGDKYISGDETLMKGDVYNTTYQEISGVDGNDYNSRIDVPAVRSPSLTNNSGIDIHEYNVGTTAGGKNIITNSETGATFKITTSGDHIFPSLLVFATDIYSPSISITKTPSTNATGTLLPGDLIDYEAVFTNVGQENAKNIFIFDDFTQNKQNDINGSQTNPLVVLSDLLDRNATKVLQSIRLSDANTVATWNCPLGTSGLIGCNGGYDANCSVDYADGNTSKMTKVWCNLPTVNVNQTFTMKFSVNVAEIPDTKGQNVKVSNQMLATYYNALVGVTPITSGSNLADAGYYYGGAIPFVDAWETSIVGAPPAVSSRKIYTKIAGDGAQTLRVASVNTANTAYSGYDSALIGWRIVPTASCPLGDGNVTSWADLNLSTGQNPKDITFATPAAGKDYKVQFTNKTGVSTYSVSNRHCSSDAFAVRPNKLDVGIGGGISPKLLKSGEDYAITMIAQDVSGNVATGYNQIHTTMAPTLTIQSPPTKRNPDGTVNNALNGTTTLAPVDFTFVNGITSGAQFSFSDVGKITLDVNDTNWAAVDVSDGTTLDQRTIKGEGSFTFIPFKFTIYNPQIVDSRNGAFTYLSSDLNMSAKLDFQVRAENKSGTTTLNFNSAAYENNISITPTISDSFRGGANESNISNISTAFIAGVDTFTWDNAEAAQLLNFNFTRDAATPWSPFEIAPSEVSITVSSVYTDAGFPNVTIENEAANKAGATNGMTGNATFLYGRTDAPDYRFANNPGCGRVWYEFFSTNNPDALVVAAFGAMPPMSESPDANWYKNTQHNSTTDGNVTATSGTASITINRPVGATPAVGCSALGSAGNDKLGFAYNGGKGYPFRGPIQLDASDWLDVTGNNFGVEFYKAGAWTGEQKNTSATDTETEKISNRRIMW